VTKSKGVRIRMLKVLRMDAVIRIFVPQDILAPGTVR
jgi:hypothetical protein